MNEDRQRILKMVADGRITPAEAEGLLDALGEPARTPSEPAPAEVERKAKPRYLRVEVTGGKEHVNVRIPLQLLRAGLKLGGVMTGFMPEKAREKVGQALHGKGIDVKLDKLKGPDLEELITQLADLSVDVDSSDGEKVRVFCE